MFIGEIDAIGTKRMTQILAVRELQQTMLELLDQLDGFDSTGDVKVIMATNRIETLVQHLIRSGCADGKIEPLLPDDRTEQRIFQNHTGRLALASAGRLWPALADGAIPDNVISPVLTSRHSV